MIDSGIALIFWGSVMTKSRDLLTSGNRLLSSLDALSRERIEPHIERLEAKAGHVVCWAGDRADHVYFPDGAILSVRTILADGSSIETANIGREGAFCLFEAMYTHSCFSECLVLMPGGLLRLPFNVLRFVFEHNAQARSLFINYTEALRNQIQQAVACYASHTVQARLSRWLLGIHDRTGHQDLPFTHEFLAHLLGANRKSVTLALQAMQMAGLISYHRGRIQILDCSGIEKSACECYSVMKNASPPW